MLVYFTSCNLPDFETKRKNKGKKVTELPYLKKLDNGYQQLVVNGKPFIMLAGELGNSTASDVDLLKAIMPRLEAMNLNTVLAPVYWDLIEKKEDEFDFTLVDVLINEARKHNMKLVLLWFGSWKNSMSCYPPPWVKEDYEKYPRAKSRNGKAQEILTPFSENNLQADKKAFVKLMNYLKEKDGWYNTVIMIQVENEIGMLPDAKDYSNAALEAFRKDVPDELIEYLKTNNSNLLTTSNASGGDWEDVFGKSLATDEIFMAWHYAQYVNEIAGAGKKTYHLPMFVNAALNRPGYKPGEYPSAGPLPHLFDIWKAGAPEINFLTPDIHIGDFAHWCNAYSLPDNALFIPEISNQRPNHVNALYAIGKYNALGISPFSIESLDSSKQEGLQLAQSYGLISNAQKIFAEHWGKRSMTAVRLTNETNGEKIEFSDYRVLVSHDFTFKWSGEREKYKVWPETGCILIELSPNEFLVCGTGIILTFEDRSGDLTAGISMVEMGTFDKKGNWKTKITLSGDQSHQGRHVRIPFGSFQLQKFTLYKYK